QPALELGQVRLAMGAFPGRGVPIPGRWPIGAPRRPIVPNVHPQPSGLGLAAPWIQYRHRGVVAVDLAGRSYVPPYSIDQWLDQVVDSSVPAGHGGAIQINALARVHLRLPVKRQVIDELAHDNVPQQS